MGQSIAAAATIRSWGYFAVLSDQNGYKVKQLTVLPGRSTSLQFHNHRSEHWFVISGLAEVTHNREQYLLYPQQFAQIELGDLHRIRNAGHTPLVIIEVQCGNYLEEDDIVRLDTHKAAFYQPSDPKVLRLNDSGGSR